jgi:phage baseplate assembly protein W
MAGYNRSVFTQGTVVYKDLDFSFLTNPMTDDLRVKTDLESIKQSFKNLLFTRPGERPFRHNIGGGLWNLLFQPLDAITLIEIKQGVSNTINTYEPRVRLLEVDAFEDKNDRTVLNITIKFMFINSSQPQTVTIMLNRTR